MSWQYQPDSVYLSCSSSRAERFGHINIYTRRKTFNFLINCTHLCVVHIRSDCTWPKSLLLGFYKPYKITDRHSRRQVSLVFHWLFKQYLECQTKGDWIVPYTRGVFCSTIHQGESLWLFQCLSEAGLFFILPDGELNERSFLSFCIFSILLTPLLFFTFHLSFSFPPSKDHLFISSFPFQGPLFFWCNDEHFISVTLGLESAKRNPPNTIQKNLWLPETTLTFLGHSADRLIEASVVRSRITRITPSSTVLDRIYLNTVIIQWVFLHIVLKVKVKVTFVVSHVNWFGAWARRAAASLMFLFILACMI